MKRIVYPVYHLKKKNKAENTSKFLGMTFREILTQNGENNSYVEVLTLGTNERATFVTYMEGLSYF